MDRIFVLMRSQGLIKETAGEWNALSGEVRKAKIDVIMKKYMESAEKVGSTFSATKESLIDVLKITGRSAIDATFERMKKGMAAVRDFLLQQPRVD
jgi:hypothetical protein